MEAWRETNEWIERHERIAKENPSEFVSTFSAYVQLQRRHIQRVIREQFGLRVSYEKKPSGEPYIESLEKFPIHFRYLPEHREAFRLLRAWLDLLAWFDGAWIAVVSARVLAEREGADPDDAVIENVFEYHRAGPWMASPTIKTEPDRSLREAYAENLSGWVGAQISLGKNGRLNSILKEDLEPGDSPRARLLRELLAATTMAFEELLPDESLRPGGGETNLVSRVERVMEELGSQKEKLRRRSKLSEDRPEPAGASTDGDLEQFEHRETLRQQLEDLKSWMKDANLSETQLKVLDLDMRTDHDTKAIAEELGISPKTVRVIRKRYRDRIRAAANL
ncbi:Homeodomain-like domain (plasmid) [Rubrobacter radiotolerans]|uniref:Homeodomain-like domain n=1 Tax=Rubrobacter radiotolerans TaxID=42256 RepID=A0A023X7I3_RUBRA|nr:Homeodomain-like domain [Rubrobacter radiotolerans]SMC01404.1 regulatory protein, luxR family [Rubrobacter radiotolerans DSM 5868]